MRTAKLPVRVVTRERAVAIAQLCWSGKQSPLCPRLRLGRVHHGAMLETFIQGIIGAFDKNLCPFHQTGGEETSERADQHLVEKRGMHARILSRRGATDAPLTRSPIALSA